jgi:hypothetical protein
MLVNYLDGFETSFVMLRLWEGETAASPKHLIVTYRAGAISSAQRTVTPLLLNLVDAAARTVSRPRALQANACLQKTFQISQLMISSICFIKTIPQKFSSHTFKCLFFSTGVLSSFSDAGLCSEGSVISTDDWMWRWNVSVETNCDRHTCEARDHVMTIRRCSLVLHRTACFVARRLIHTFSI